MLGNIISTHRKRLGLTQEQLAQKLDVTNQAVSKWETDQSCPDVAMLPKLAELFGISMDELFGKEPTVRETVQDLPWEDDEAFRIVLYRGRELLRHSENAKEFTFKYEGPAQDVYSDVGLECGKVVGNATASGYIECGDVGGYAMAGSYVECNDIGKYVCAGSYVECNNVGGYIISESYVECNDVKGNVRAEGYVECAAVGGDVTAGGYVEFSSSKGQVRKSSGVPGMSCDNCPGSCNDCGCNGMGCGGMNQNK